MAFTDITGKVKTSRPALPQIYAYTPRPRSAAMTAGRRSATPSQDVEERVRQQTHTANVYAVVHWHGNAVYEDTGEMFRDTDFHGYLRKLDVANEPRTEWFHIEPNPAKMPLLRVPGEPRRAGCAVGNRLRCCGDEQRDAVRQTADYARSHDRGEFLWNAKPRFGKTLTCYDLCRELWSNEGPHRDQPSRHRQLLVRRLREVRGRGVGPLLHQQRERAAGKTFLPVARGVPKEPCAAAARRASSSS